MRPTVVSQTGAGASAVIVPDYMIAPFQLSVGCRVSGGAATFTVEHTYDDPFAPGFNPATATWFPNATLTAKTANAEGTYTTPVRAIRLNVASGPGKVDMVVIQAGRAGD